MPIDPTACVHPSVEIDPSNEVGPNVTIEADVVIGLRNQIMAGAFIGPGTTIGDDNRIHMRAVVGHEPQDYAFEGEQSFTRIGNRNEIREFATIHRGTGEGTATEVGDDCFIMVHAHVAHNCVIGSKVTLANLCSMAGHVSIGDGAFISGNCVIHQYCRIGALSMLGGLSAVNRDLPPFMLARGRPAAVAGVNAIGLRRASIGPEVRKELKRAYKTIYRAGNRLTDGLAELAEIDMPEIQTLVRFIEESKRGIMIGAEGGGARDNGE
jgi:UDP-N-acetylglucosamine acyltransferase